MEKIKKNMNGLGLFLDALATKPGSGLSSPDKLISSL
jgi:hypothetical protein